MIDKTKILRYLLLAILSMGTTLSLTSQFSSPFEKKKDPLVKVTKSGIYMGIQRGKYNNLEFGYELQRKAIKLRKPLTRTANIGFDYNWNQNILGFTVGYWQKKGRMDFTYGANLVFKSNFNHNRIGVSPMIGYKFSIAHLQVGYNLLSNKNSFDNTNTLFISLRAVLINNRSYDWRKRKKKE